MARDFFFDVPRTAAMTTEGRVDLPMFFYDSSVRCLNFFVDYVRTVPLLEGTGLEPVRFFNGKALVNLMFFQYREVGIGGYDEVFITITVVPEGFPKPRYFLTNLLKQRGDRWTMGGYVLEMPVTIPQARAAGREIWGYPKFETEIPFELSGRRFRFGVNDPGTGEPLLSVSGAETPGVRLPGFDLVSFTNHDGKILRVTVDVDGSLRHSVPRGIRVVTGSSDHRFAKNLRDLGLDRVKPWSCMCSDAVRTRLNPGVPVADHKTPPMPYAVAKEEWASPLQD